MKKIKISCIFLALLMFPAICVAQIQTAKQCADAQKLIPSPETKKISKDNAADIALRFLQTQKLKVDNYDLQLPLINAYCPPQSTPFVWLVSFRLKEGGAIHGDIHVAINDSKKAWFWP